MLISCLNTSTTLALLLGFLVERRRDLRSARNQDGRGWRDLRSARRQDGRGGVIEWVEPHCVGEASRAGFSFILWYFVLHSHRLSNLPYRGTSLTGVVRFLNGEEPLYAEPTRRPHTTVTGLKESVWES